MAETAQLQKLIEDLGGSRAVHAEVEQYLSLFRAFNERRADFLSHYPNKWIAMYGEQVVVADTQEELLAEERAAGFPPGRAFVEFLATEPQMWAL